MEADRVPTFPVVSNGHPTPRGLAAGDIDSAGPVGTDVLEASPDGLWVPVGAPVSAAASASAPPPPPAPGRRRWRLSLLYGVALALLATTLFVAVDLHAQIHRSDSDLTAARTHLRQTITRAHRAEAALSTVSAQSAAAAHTLAAETSQLAAAEAQLASTAANVFANGVSINNLDTCLAGVEQALNQISLDDQSGAAATLDRVAAACRAAEPSP